MSDGSSDSNAIGKIASQLENAAYDLRTAIEAAERGHRGISVDIQATINEVLGRRGGLWRIRKEVPWGPR